MTMHATNNNHHGDTDNSVAAAFYEASTGKWYPREGWPTPDGRNGYHRMLVNGRSAIGVCQRAVYESSSRYAAWGKDYTGTWRKITLFACDDLTSAPWRMRRYWLDPQFGATMIWDIFRGPDGHAYVAYDHAYAETYETSNIPSTLHIARIHEDLSAEVFDLGIANEGGRPCPLFDRNGNWYLSYWDKNDACNMLLKLDPAHGFKPVSRYVLGDAETPMVLYVLRPEQFGGETIIDDTARYISRTYRPQGEGHYPLIDVVYGEFELPVNAVYTEHG